jgi:hypothetical protein
MLDMHSVILRGLLCFSLFHEYSCFLADCLFFIFYCISNVALVPCHSVVDFV